jgi:hypothetical protein
MEIPRQFLNCDEIITEKKKALNRNNAVQLRLNGIFILGL